MGGRGGEVGTVRPGAHCGASPRLSNEQGWTGASILDSVDEASLLFSSNAQRGPGASQVVEEGMGDRMEGKVTNASGDDGTVSFVAVDHGYIPIVMWELWDVMIPERSSSSS